MPTICAVTPRDRLARDAARNNAEWCDALCRTHGIPGRFDPGAWVDPVRTPRYYPDAVTLDPGVDAASILERIDTTSPGCSVKDSFANLDLRPDGFEVVHEAEWIHRGPQAAPVINAGAMTWAPIRTPDALIAWEAAWDVDRDSARLFRPALLLDPAITVIGGFVDGSIVAGAIANRTRSDLVGLSNVFAIDDDLDRAWSGSITYLDTALAGRAIVGYESGDSLSIALRQGFQTIGPLRIWLKDA
jgi:hypothetical protein